LPYFASRPLQRRYFALFAFWTFILFAPWCGIPQGAPVPAWLPAASTVASILTLLPLIAVAAVFLKTVCGVHVQCKGGPYCYAKFGTVAFLLSALMLIVTGCPHFGRMAGFTWYMQAQTLLQILGFFAIIAAGGIYESLPFIMGFELPFRKFVRLQHWCFMIGLLLLVVPLAIGGIEQGLKMRDASLPFTDIIQGTLMYLRISTLGLLALLLGSLLLVANIFAMTIKWHLGLIKCVITAINAPLETGEVKS
jgi:cbb3-type cytochrome oxidase subunit 1